MKLDPSDTAPRTLGAVRRLVIHGLLFILLMLAATGMSGLLAVAFGGGRDTEGSGELAYGLTLTLVCVPLSWLLWRWMRRGLSRVGGTDAVIWSLQAAAVYLVALMTASIALLRTLAGVLTTQPDTWGDTLAAAIGWGLLFVWQYRALRAHPPTRIESLAWVSGSVFGLLFFGGAAIGLLRTAFDALLSAPDARLLIGAESNDLRASLVYTVGSAAIWWWHWRLRGVRQRTGGYATVMLLLAGLALPAVTALLSAAATLDTLLPIPWDRRQWWPRVDEHLPAVLAAALIGTLVWLFHRPVVAAREERIRLVAGQIVSGIAVAMIATGLGVLTNALLAAYSPALIGAGSPAMVRSGLSLLVVGVPTWLLAFRPLRAADPSARRLYLVLFFGISALVALSALLVVGYRTLDAALSDGNDELLGLIRAPLGVLLSTGLVAYYHFALWRHDRALLPAPAAVTPRNILLISPEDSAGVEQMLEPMPGVKLRTVLSAGAPLAEPITGEQLTSLSEEIARAGENLVLLIDADGSHRLIPVEDKPW